MTARERISITNLLASSEEKVDFAIAVLEWQFTGEINVIHDADAKCELCEHRHLRYHFEIGNENGNRMKVGSSCIKKFNILVKDEEGITYTGDVVRYLNGLAQEKRRNEAMERLLKTRPNRLLGAYTLEELDEHCCASLLKKGNLDAKEANYLFRRFEEENIHFEPKDFPIAFKGFEDKTRLLALKTEQFERIKPALSNKHIEYYVNAKEFAPGGSYHAGTLRRNL